MQRMILAALAFGACLIAAAHAETPPALAAAAAQYEQVAGDAPALEQLVADDYVLIGGDGTRQSKAELIAFWTTDGFDPNPVEVREPIAHIWADGAALGGTATLSGVSDGAPFSITMRYIDLWALREGAWRVVYGQVTRAAD